jgi:anthranilate synthase/aminodeoxychorismate synthase-like glutamine amidotransferase
MTSVLVVDNYDSFTYNLVQYLGELGAEVDVVRNDLPELLERSPDRVIVSPGPCTPEEAGLSKQAIRRYAEDGVPVLGVCLGAQLLAAASGAEVRRSPSPEIGWFDVARTPEGELDPLFGRLPSRFLAYEWHSYAFAMPAGSVMLAHSAACPQAFRLGEHAWGVQFHPEVVPEIVREWALDYESDADAIAMGFDPPAHIAEAAERLPAWMEIGRTLFEGFLTAASAAPRAPLAAARSAQVPPPRHG